MKKKKIRITIRLVGEEKDVEHKKVDVNPEIHVNDLQKLVEKWTKIPPNFQQIEFNGTEMPYAEHPLRNSKYGEELVVKHSELPWWNVYKNCVELMKSHWNKAELAKEAVEHHERLTNSGFFKVYAQFNQFQIQNHHGVAAWTEGKVGLICKTTEKFFRDLHDQKRGEEDSKFICYFEERPEELGGSSTNTIAFIQIFGEDDVSKYNIKCHHNDMKDKSAGQLPDISEFFCYKLLASIGVGPKAHIIPPSMSTGTRTIPYVATQWDDRFELLDTILDEESLTADVVAQLVMLKVLLFISDLHEWNCGRWKGTQNVAIVDFAPTDDLQVYDDIKSKLLSTFPHKDWKKAYSVVKNEHDDDSWLKIAKKYLDQWDFANKIELVREEFDPTKGILKELEIDFKKWHFLVSPTDQLKEYIDTLRENVENLQTLLNSLV